MLLTAICIGIPAYLFGRSFAGLQKCNRKSIEFCERGWFFQGLMAALEVPMFCFVGMPCVAFFLWLNVADGSFTSAVFFMMLGFSYPIMMVGCAMAMVAQSFLIYWQDKTPEAVVKEMQDKHIEWKDKEFKGLWYGTKMPIETAIEAFQDQKIDWKPDVLTVMRNRCELFRFTFTAGHVKSLQVDLLRRVWKHDADADHADISDVYNKGNDFYGWFLCNRNIYSSAIWTDSKEENENQKIEDGQHRKLNHLCKDLSLMKKGMEHLDLGCGWGAMVLHASKHFGTKTTGVTLSKEQAKYIESLAPEYMKAADNTDEENNRRIKEAATKVADSLDAKKDKETLKVINDNLKIRIMNAWDLEDTKKYDVITCLEMSEHIGVRDYQKFMHKVRGMLKDDGVFYLQIAGLRRNWQYEDLQWGLFMNRYVFPGADASCPLYWDIEQLERAGWDVRYVENRGFHYGLTILTWYKNWVKNKAKVVAKYGEWNWRNWSIFLSWSYLIAMQGSSTVYMISMSKAMPFDERSCATPSVADKGFDPENKSSPHFGIHRANMWIDDCRPPFTEAGPHGWKA